MPKQLSQPETLFDDDTFSRVEHIVYTQGLSYNDARRIDEARHAESTYHIPEVKITEPSDGVSVELGARALALNNIMATYNHLNKTMGANIISQIPDSEFNTRYQHPEQVREHMGGKAAAMLHYNVEDFTVLNATKELIDAGFDTTQVEMQQRAINKDLLNKYGPGKAYAPARKKLVKKVSNTAQRVNNAR